MQGSPERKLRVLVVDDDALVLMHTAAMLNDLGHETVMASGGPEALTCLGESGPSAFDLLVTDQSMPQLDGVELARQVRREWPTMPVILASGYCDPGDATHGVAQGHLLKPFGLGDLRTVIASVVAAETAGTGGAAMA
ncbi:response regulator [Jiella sonneratiae]|uniref:Response regulator n=1 Tax=Jiella sonneratiae TaxID=2816856 RepID=A0ABS3J6Z2_9HYPH|nr:response regulator [Jiella sonneratiae]MBO0905417.1 response regulator [Jiella sonneratiae]